MNYEDFWHPLTAVYDRGEAQAVARLVLEQLFGLTWTDILTGKSAELPQQQLETILQRLLKSEPVQYVLGTAEFGGRMFQVAPGVLIPRPETLELCHWVISEADDENNKICATSILDIGTGSGCIACTLAAELPHTRVTAWDISTVALAIARKNAKRTHVLVTFEQVDILTVEENSTTSKWQIIVSNPPYICRRERAAMDRNVLDYEPEAALFVPDDDPLLFYRNIGKYATNALAPGGRLYFEMNALYAEEVSKQLQELGFKDIVIKQDQFGKDRFIRACKQEKN